MEMLAISGLQLLIQYGFYSLVKDIILTLIIKIYKLCSVFCKDRNKLTKYISWLYLVILIALNITISIFVVWFTSAGKVAGITNLSASCVLFLIMKYDVHNFKQACLGKYHK